MDEGQPDGTETAGISSEVLEHHRNVALRLGEIGRECRRLTFGFLGSLGLIVSAPSVSFSPMLPIGWPVQYSIGLSLAGIGMATGRRFTERMQGLRDEATSLTEEMRQFAEVCPRTATSFCLDAEIERASLIAADVLCPSGKNKE